MTSTPVTTSSSAAASTAKRAAVKPLSSPNRAAPHAKATMMFRGAHEPAARASPMASEAWNAQ